MCCQVLPLVRRIEVSYRRQLDTDVHHCTRRVDGFDEQVTELGVTSQTKQKPAPCRVVRGTCVATPTWQQPRRQTSVVAANNEAIVDVRLSHSAAPGESMIIHLTASNHYKTSVRLLSLQSISTSTSLKYYVYSRFTSFLAFRPPKYWPYWDLVLSTDFRFQTHRRTPFTNPSSDVCLVLNVSELLLVLHHSSM